MIIFMYSFKTIFKSFGNRDKAFVAWLLIGSIFSFNFLFAPQQIETKHKRNDNDNNNSDKNNNNSNNVSRHLLCSVTGWLSHRLLCTVIKV